MKKAMKPASTEQAWWRFGLVWMVLAGPAVVVVAGFITFYIALANPDPVLQVTPRTAVQERQGITHAPAMQGRNHAATGELPGATQMHPITGSGRPVDCAQVNGLGEVCSEKSGR
jgi:hypothetical protein